MSTRPETTHLFTEIDHMEVCELSLSNGLCVGSTRQNPISGPNEDAFLIHTGTGQEAVVAVADGVGGSKSGHIASRIALTVLAEELHKAVEQGTSIRSSIVDGFERGNKEILALGVGAATTLIVAEITPNSIRSYHVGDSFALVVGQRGKQKYQTIDHSPVGYAVQAGLVEEDDAISHDERHIVNNVMGSTDMRIEIGPVVPLSQFDTLVLGSDGLSDNLSMEEITERFRKGKLPDAMKSVFEECQRRMNIDDGTTPSKPDDLTVIAFRQSLVGGKPKRKE